MFGSVLDNNAKARGNFISFVDIVKYIVKCLCVVHVQHYENWIHFIEILPSHSQ